MKRQIFTFLLTSCFVVSIAQKPNIWLLSDFTGFKKGEAIWKDSSITESHLNTQSDADDYCALSMYLMHANKFNTIRLVLGSDRAKPGKSTNAVDEFFKWFVPAYRHDVKYWNSENGIGGYPSVETIISTVRLASTQGTSFDSAKSYKEYGSLPPTVQELIDELNNKKYNRKNPLFVMNWGPMTEIAIAIKHLREVNNDIALGNLFIVSHWTTSIISRNKPSTCISDSLSRLNYGVANCNEDCNACLYVHIEAENPNAVFRFAELGGIGQNGIVHGSKAYFAPNGLQHPKAKMFMNSEMGRLFITSKFVDGSPDGSDAATFYAILGTYGIGLSNFSENGRLTEEQEKKGQMAFQNQAPYIYDELLAISNVVPNNKQTPDGNLNYPFLFRAETNPIVKHIRTADPDCHVWEDGRLWMYTSQDHDPDLNGKSYAKMDGYHAYSSIDLLHWIDYGEILHSKDVEWGTNDGGWMWAPGAAYKNGTYYLYYPHKNKENTFRIGVATSKVPQGPFIDIGNYIEGTFGIDPMCFIDDDGTAYLYFAKDIAKLKPNMIELAEPPRKIDYGANNRKDTNEDMGEAPWMFKNEGKYYFSYCNYNNKEHQGYYAIGDNPYGPFKWKGAIKAKPPGAQDHHSIINFKGKWLYFYHIGNFSDAKGNKGNPTRRNVCVDYLNFNADGTIKMVKPTTTGVSFKLLDEKIDLQIY